MISGVINWPRHGELTWQNTGEGGTFVFAVWLADHRPKGLDLFDPPHTHRDWFLQDPSAQYILDMITEGPCLYTSPNADKLIGGRAIGALCLGTSVGTYYSSLHRGYWWADEQDLTRDGRRMVRSVSDMYARRPHLLTYMNVEPMSVDVPEAVSGSATVGASSGS